VYYGTSSGNYSQISNVGNTTIATISNLSDGLTYYFVVTDYNTAGVESPPSNQVAVKISANSTPSAPSNQGSGPTSPNSPPSGQSTIAPVDFDGDGREDLLWRNGITGDTWIWLMNGNSIAGSGRVAIVDLSWTIVGVGNFDGLGRRDIVWYNASLGQVAIWTVNGLIETGSYEFPAPAGAPGEWTVVGIADFDQTGLSDILWQDTSTGALYMWKSVSPFAFVSIEIGTADPSWSVVGTADVEGSGLPDIIWRNSVTGGVYIWQLRNDQVSQEVSLGEYSLDWQIAGFGDFNGDGKQDILWRNNSTGDVYVLLMNGFSVAAQWYSGAPSLTWKVVGTPDLNGDGLNDVLWLDPSAGLVSAWFGTPTNLAQLPPFASVGAGWSVAPSQ
jgi:hypothetical protein